ncbi:MAG: nicotinate (nicotinamide) nucleotide adenylyltransferase [Planctomycetota bacterium]
MSEKRDLWVPLALALAGIALLAANLAQGRVLTAVLALSLGLGGAVACLPLRMRRTQARIVGFGTGMAFLLVPLVPGWAARPADALAWVVVALAFLLPAPPLPIRVRGGLLGAALLMAVLGFLAVLGILPRALAWLFLAGAFHFALQVFHTRPRTTPAPPPGPRIALFGGSFDPFHRGHRALAEAALKVVDRLLVIPAGQAPHKGESGGRTPFHHRVAMARLGVEGLARTEVLELEGRRPGPSYTIDTLEVIRHSQPEGARFLIVLGADMFQDFPNWRAWEQILEEASLLVAARDGFDLEPPPEFEGRSVALERLVAPRVDVSSTALRGALARGENVGDLVSPAVRAYVRDHVLYHRDAR